RTTAQNSPATASPHSPYRTSTPRQFTPDGSCPNPTASPTPASAAVRVVVSHGADAPPIRPPSATTDLNRPRSSGRAHRFTNPAAAGYAPDSVTPSISRTASKAANDWVNPVAAVTSDHAAIDTVSTARAPNRSASAPTGIWNRA